MQPLQRKDGRMPGSSKDSSEYRKKKWAEAFKKPSPRRNVSSNRRAQGHLWRWMRKTKLFPKLSGDRRKRFGCR